LKEIDMDAITQRTTSGRGRLYDSILDTIGDTPVIRVNNLAPDDVTIYVKSEFFNPAASVKDRLAVNIIEAAEREGKLKPGQTVVEATSGNTGIGLAMVCAQKGYPLVVTMADSFSVERRRLMRMLGAKVVLTPRAQKGFGMYRRPWNLPRRMAGSSPGSSRRPPMPTSTRRRPPAKSSVTSRATGSTMSSPATARAELSPGIGRVMRKERPEHGSSCRTRECAIDRQRHRAGSAARTDRPLSATRPSSRIPIQGWTPDFIP
jgi:cysteine synthase A